MQDYSVNVNFCGYSDGEINRVIRSTSSISASPMYTNSNIRGVALTSDIVNDAYAVLFMGTNTGHLKKVIIA